MEAIATTLLSKPSEQKSFSQPVGGRGNMPVAGQPAEESIDLRAGHLPGVADAMEAEALRATFSAPLTLAMRH